MPTKLLIVEDHPLYADALQLVIRKSMNAVQLTHVETMAAARTTMQLDGDFDLILLDLCLPDTHGFEGLVQLRRCSPRLPVIIVSAFSDPGVVKTATICGAAGFIPKSAAIDAIVQGIRNTLAGDVTLPEEQILQGNCVATAELDTLVGRLNTLTEHQFMVLRLLCQGLLNVQIAHELRVRPSTIKAHVSEVLRKLGACSRTHAVAKASKLSLSAVQALYARQSVSDSQCLR